MFSIVSVWHSNTVIDCGIPRTSTITSIGQIILARKQKMEIVGELKSQIVTDGTKAFNEICMWAKDKVALTRELCYHITVCI